MVPYANTTIDLPAKWDDGDITRLLQRHQDQPAVLSHAVSSIRTRLIMGQDVKSAQQRLKLVTNVIEVFKLNRELQGILHDLQLAEKELEIRQIEAATRLEDAQVRQKSEQQLRKLRQQRDELQLQKEIAQLQQETSAIQAPPKQQILPPRQPSIDEQIAAQEAKIKRYEQETAERQKGATSPPEAQKWKVFYEDLIHDAQEDLKKLLRRR
jgi:hypothetical protein